MTTEKHVRSREEITIALSKVSEELMTTGRAVTTVNAASSMIRMLEAVQHQVGDAEFLEYLEVGASLIMSSMLFERSKAPRSDISSRPGGGRRVVDTVSDSAAGSCGNPPSILTSGILLKPQ